MSNKNSYVRMSRAFPALYQVGSSTILKGLLKAFGLSDDQISEQIVNTKDQLFVSTASDRFLDYLGNNVGVNRDPGLGIEDADFRKLIPVLSFFPKQVRATLVALLDVFWGPLFTRPNVSTSNVETFDLGPESLLTGTATFKPGEKLITGVGTLFLTEVSPGDYIKPSSFTGTNYAKVLKVESNTVLELSMAWEGAIAVNASVSKGVIRELKYVADSNSEKTIRFLPSAFEDITAVTIEELANFINNHEEHRDYITGSEEIDPLLGSKFNIRTNTAGLQGAIQITGGDANTALRLNFPTDRKTETRANVIEINPNEIVIKIPSSVPVLRRSLRGSIHPRNTKTIIYSSEEVFDFNSLGPSSTLTLEVNGTPDTVTFTHATDFADPTAATAEEVVDAINAQVGGLQAFTGTEESYKRVGLKTTNGEDNYEILGGTANTLLNFATGLQEDPALLDPDFLSAYLFDPTGQLYTTTGTKSTLTSAIDQGTVQTAINLNNASSFPNQPGKIIFDFGRSTQEGPIEYSSRPNNSTLLIDASHIFEFDHGVNSTVNFVQDTPSVPRVTGEDYAAFITGTEEAREAAQNLLKNLVAAGVVIRFVIDFVEYLFVCTCRDCGPGDDPDLTGSRTALPPLVF